MHLMCGIAGIVTFDGQPADPRQLRVLCDALAHRGPDDRGTWVGVMGGCGVALAQTRLAVIDLSSAGHQPMAAADQRCRVVFNGEIYNYRQLREELSAQGARFGSHSDTEVVLAAYQRWGSACFDRFNGMWALALIDSEAGCGLLVRDRFGIKPLYYIVLPQRLVFASEMAALLRLGGWQRRIDPVGLNHYLRLGFVPHPHTIFQAVRKLGPGQWLRFDQQGVGRPESYYSLQPEPSGRDDYQTACRQLRRRIGEAVAARTVADVPVGAFLSGGIDSSIVVAHLAASAAGTVSTYSIGYAGQDRYDETRFARLVADRYGTQHHEFRLSFNDLIAALPGLLDHVAEPFGDSSLIPTALVSRYTREHVKVALSGDGGDELFAGYWRHRGLAYLRKYRRLPGLLRKGLIEPLVRSLPSGKDTWLANRVRQARKLVRAGGGGEIENYLRFCQIMAPEAQMILQPDAGADFAETALADSYRRCSADDQQPGDPLNRILLGDLRYALANDMLHKIDLASMRFGLEVRVPLLDRAVVEYAMGLPGEFKLAGGAGKRALIDAHRDLLPEQIQRRGKMGFEVPMGEFLRDRLGPMFREVVSAEVISRIGWLDHGAIMRVYEQHCRRRGEHGDLLYALLALCWWYRRWVSEGGTQDPREGV